MRRISAAAFLSLGVFALAGSASAADLASATCDARNPQNSAPFCNAARGDRSEGWLGQGRSETMARNGMVTTSQPLAAEAGLEILRKGGNAVDAAVAAAAVLNLVEPMNEGMAGDLFAIIYTARDHQLHAINASGMAAGGQTLAFMNAHGYKWDPRDINPGSGMARGVLSVTVPGAAWGWGEVLDKYGTMKFAQVLAPAADYAEKGFPISERIANDWHLPKAVNAANPGAVENCCSDLDPDSVRTWYINGKQPKAGDIYKNPDLARTFRILMAKGRDGFYKGEVAAATVAKMRKLGSPVTMQDFADYKGEWVQPVTSEYHGFTLAELPPPSNGFGAQEMLSILAACTGKVYPGQTLASLGPRDARYWHMLIEAKALAYADLNANNGDPNFDKDMLAKVKMLTSADHASDLCGKISPDKAMALTSGGEGGGDTIVLATADRWGNMVSWVNSNFATFGSGITVPGYGFILHNRGGLFTLDPSSPNVIAPHKRPYNTLEAGFVMQGGRTDGQLMALTLMGGDMQAQGHAQMMVNMIDLGANLQASTDMARFHHNQNTGAVQLETEAFKLVGPQLKAMGHNITSVNGGGMGGYQALLFTPDPNEPKPSMARNSQQPVNGYYRAGTDHRKDGISAGY